VQRCTLCVLHDDAKFVAGGLVEFLELDDVRVLQDAVKLSLPQCGLALFGREVADVYALHHVLKAVLRGPHQVGLAHRALTQHSYFLVLFSLAATLDHLRQVFAVLHYLNYH